MRSISEGSLTCRCASTQPSAGTSSTSGEAAASLSHVPEDLFELNSTDWGFNVGAGVTGFFTDNIGLRGDVRYFRSLEDNEPDDEFDVALSDFRFWRGTVGVTFRF